MSKAKELPKSIIQLPGFDTWQREEEKDNWLMIGYQAGYGDGKKAGKIEGARRELRALKRILSTRTDGHICFWIEDWLAARAKPAKRKGGK